MAIVTAVVMVHCCQKGFSNSEGAITRGLVCAFWRVWGSNEVHLSGWRCIPVQHFSEEENDVVIISMRKRNQGFRDHG